jgi:hypothetical protein
LIRIVARLAEDPNMRPALDVLGFVPLLVGFLGQQFGRLSQNDEILAVWQTATCTTCLGVAKRTDD